jgi:5'-methylthioadenosine phosphorylase
LDRKAETPAEIECSGDWAAIFGVTRVPEAVLAGVLEMCYTKVCSVSNMTVGLQEKLTLPELWRCPN